MPTQNLLKMPTKYATITPLFAAFAAQSTFPIRKIVAHLPSRFRQRVLNHLEQRKAQNGGLPLLGEIAPRLLSELLPRNADLSAHPLIIAWWQLYISVILSDDLLDEPQRHEYRELIIPAMLLQQRAITSVLSCSDDILQRNLAHQLACCFDSMAVSADQELAQDSDSKFSDNLSLSIARRKLSLLELLGHLICSLAPENRERLSLVIRCVRKLSIMSQILDDITDAPHDLQQGHRTLMTSKLIASTVRRRHTHQWEFDWNLVIDNGSLEDSLRIAFKECKGAISVIERMVKSGLGLSFLTTLLNRIESASVLANKARKEGGSKRNPLRKQLRHALTVLAYGS